MKIVFNEEKLNAIKLVFGVNKLSIVEENKSYAISNCGRVFCCLKNTKYTNPIRELKPYLNNKGYYTIGFRGNKYKRYSIARLLAISFIPNPNKLPVVRHLNDIHSDNRLENLVWGTQKDNIHDALRNGHWNYKKGEKGNNTKLKVIDVLNIRKLRKEGMYYSEIANKYKMARSSIMSICKKETWKYIE